MIATQSLLRLVARAGRSPVREEALGWGLAALLGVSMPVHACAAQQRGRGTDEPAIEFSHPLVTESPSPDTKIRFDDIERTQPDSGIASVTRRVETEYAFRPWLSLAFTLPVESRTVAGVRHTDVGSTEVALKFAGFRLAEDGVLYGGGLNAGLPTGSDVDAIGSAHAVDMEGFADIAVRGGPTEYVAFLSYSTTANTRAGDTGNREISVNASSLYHIGRRMDAMLELDARRPIGASAVTSGLADLAPGIKMLPFHNPHIMVGVSVRVPITREREFEREVLLSAMYHF